MVRDDRVRGGTVLIAVGRCRYLTVGQAEANPLAFLRCKTQSDYEAMILTPEQAFAILLELPEPDRTLTLWLPTRDCELASVWACSGRMSFSPTR